MLMDEGLTIRLRTKGLGLGLGLGLGIGLGEGVDSKLLASMSDAT